MNRPREEEPRELIYGVNPILEALEQRVRSLDRVLVARDARREGIGRVLRLARAAGVPVSHVDRAVLARKAGRGRSHQGVVAIVSAAAYADADELCRRAAGHPGAILVALDRVTDTGNLGAIVRTVAAVGAQGILLAAEGTAGLGPGVAKASAGALEHVPVAREPRLPGRLRGLAENGFSVVALVPRARRVWYDLDLTGKLVVVAGGEERGARPGVLAACTTEASIPLPGGVESLNVSVAVGVALFEAVRQRAGADSAGGS